MKFRIRVVEGDWYIPEVKMFWWWVQIAGGRSLRDDAIMEIGRYAINERQR